MCVLQVRAGVSCEGSHLFEVEFVVVSVFPTHILNHHARYTQDISSLCWILDLRILCFVGTHDFMHCFSDVVENVAEEDGCAVAGTHFCDFTEADVGDFGTGGLMA